MNKRSKPWSLQTLQVGSNMTLVFCDEEDDDICNNNRNDHQAGSNVCCCCYMLKVIQ